jgi:hypothetical protein
VKCSAVWCGVVWCGVESSIVWFDAKYSFLKIKNVLDKVEDVEENSQVIKISEEGEYEGGVVVIHG